MASKRYQQPSTYDYRNYPQNYPQDYYQDQGYQDYQGQYQKDSYDPYYYNYDYDQNIADAQYYSTDQTVPQYGRSPAAYPAQMAKPYSPPSSPPEAVEMQEPQRTAQERLLFEYDPSNKGPTDERHCTDIACCFIFFIFFEGLITTAVYAFVWGDSRILYYPMDSKGYLCGVGKHKERENLFYFDITDCSEFGPGIYVHGCPTPQVCVSKCPTQNHVWQIDPNNGSKENLICQHNTDKSSKSVSQLVMKKDCAAYYLKSKAVLKRCVPDEVTSNTANSLLMITSGGTQFFVRDSNNYSLSVSDLQIGLRTFRGYIRAKEFAEKNMNDVISSWHHTLSALVMTMLISHVWIAMMSYAAELMVWIGILLYCCICPTLIGLCFWQFDAAKASGKDYKIHLGFVMTFSKEDFFLTLGIMLTIFFVFTFLIVLNMCERIWISVELIKEGSRAIGKMMLSLMWPVFPLLMQLVIITFWISIATYLMLIGQIEQLSVHHKALSKEEISKFTLKARAKELFLKVPCENKNEDAEHICGVIKYSNSEGILFLQIFMLIMVVWSVNFIVAVDQTTLAGAFATYYWTFEKRNIPPFSLLNAFCKCIRFHLGSLALGSMLLTYLQLFRITLEYLDSVLKNKNNALAKFTIKCLESCFWCLEHCLKLMTRNAFVMIAIYGKDFCTSARKACRLTVPSVSHVLFADHMTDFIFFISRFAITAAVATGSYFFFIKRIHYPEEYAYPFNFIPAPVVIVVLGSYMITAVYFNVYNMAVNTFILCYLEDLEKNDGSEERPYFMSKELMTVLDKQSRFEDYYREQ